MNSTPSTTAETARGHASLWIGVGVVFTLMAVAWTAMFFFASKHRPADVREQAGEAVR